MMATTLATGRAQGSDAEEEEEETTAAMWGRRIRPRGELGGRALPRRRLLLVLDLNGLLLDSFDRGDSRPPGLEHVHVGRKWIYRRPGVEEFLRFCFSRFDVGVWSCAREENVRNYVGVVVPEELQPKLVFVWGQDRCTDTGQRVPSAKLGRAVKPMFLKELAVLWEEFPKYGRANTIMLDDTPYKSLLNPKFTAIFPEPYSAFNHGLDDGSLVRVVQPWLEDLCVSNETVQSYVDRKPLGQPAITPSHPDWKLYSGVVNVETFRRPAMKYSDCAVDPEPLPDRVDSPLSPTPSAPWRRSRSLPFPLPIGWPEDEIPSQEPEPLPLMLSRVQSHTVPWMGQVQRNLPSPFVFQQELQLPLPWGGEHHQTRLWTTQMAQYFPPVPQQAYLQTYLQPVGDMHYQARGDNRILARNDDHPRRPRRDSHNRYRPYESNR